MKLESFFKKSFLTENPTIETVLTRYDSDRIDKRDNMYSKEEVSLFIDESIIPIGSVLNKLLTKSVFKMIDFNKDEYITIKEIDDFLIKDYEIKLEDIQNKNALDVCRLIDEITIRKKLEKKKSK